MILYYTGTGNSAYAACRIAADIGDEAVNLFPRLRDGDTSTVSAAVLAAVGERYRNARQGRA